MKVSLEHGTVQQVIGRVGEGVSSAFRARVLLESGRTVTAVVKLADGAALAAEVHSALVGRLAGLPIPEPIIARYGTRLGFGSIAVDPSFSLARVPLMQRAAHTNALLKWGRVVDSAAFDEWIGNSDRHGGNILVSGPEDFWLVDHERAVPDDLKLDELCQQNCLFERLLDATTCESERNDNRAKATASAMKHASLPLPPDFGPILDHLPSVKLSSRRVHEFIRGRVAHLVALCQHRTPTAQTDLEDNHG